MKLAVFSGQYFWFDGKYYSTNEAFVKFVSSLSRHFEKIVFCDAVIEEKETKAYRLDPRNTEVCRLPYFSVYSFWKNLLVTYPKIYRTIGENLDQWDLVWLSAVPHPVALLFAYVCKKKGTPFFLGVRQNLMEQVRHRNTGIRRHFGLAAVVVLDYFFRRLSRNHLTFTVGREMYDVYSKRGGPVCQIAVSLVTQNDIEETIRTRNLDFHNPVRLLSVGRLDPEKGLSFLIGAVEELVTRTGLCVFLQIAGKGLKGNEERGLREMVEKRQLNGHIRFLGYVKHGPELLKLYRDSDIFILPSLTGEGLPQTLLEAMGCGTPAIATRVAGIPALIEDGRNGLIVSPGSVRDLCDAIERLIATPQLRKRLVSEGLRTVESHTLDISRNQIIRNIADWCQ